MDTFPIASLAPFIVKRVLLVIGFNELQRMDLVSWFPSVIGFRITLPFDQVLESSRPPRTSVINNLFDFVFLFSFNEVWGWLGIVGSMCCRFTIRG